MKFDEMLVSMNRVKGSKDVSDLIEWGRKNKVFVKDFIDLKNVDEVKNCIKKLKEKKLWK